MEAERTSYVVAGWGAGELWTAEGVVLAHEFSFASSQPGSGVSGTATVATADPAPPPFRSEAVSIGADVAQPPLHRGTCLTPEEVVGRLQAYLAGEAVTLGDVPIDLSSSTPFQYAVATTLRALPRGEVVTYGELAALAGHPGAQRAVGTFCARNRFMFLLPCHRVVGADGIGGYGSAGVAVKRRLLRLENVAL